MSIRQLIPKAQSGVALTNISKEMSLGRYPVFDKMGIFNGDKKINWLNKPITKQINIPQSEVNRIDKVFSKIKSFNVDLIKNGYTKEQSAGVLGNIFMESGFNPAINQHGGGPGFGLGQWEKGNSRYKELANLADNRQKPITDEEIQKEYLITELNAPKRKYIENSWGGRGRKEEFLKTKNVSESADKFSKLFLRPGTPHLEKRIQYSNYIYDRLTE